MMSIIRNRVLSWTIRSVLIVLGVALVAGIAFLQGMFYANKKATLQMANDGCFYSVYALRGMKNPGDTNMVLLFDMDMDSSALKLAEMSLRYPRTSSGRNTTFWLRCRITVNSMVESHEGQRLILLRVER